MHAAVKPPVVVISRPNSAAANKSDTRAVVPSTPARPANPPGLRSGRPTSCSPVARRRDLVPQQLIQSQRALGTSSFAQAVTGSSATPLVEQRQNQPGRTQESRRAPFDEDEESESSSVFAATLVRKEAEEAVQQLARRIAHYHSQEERVLREVWSAKRTLEVALAAREPDAELMHQATVSSHTRSRTELARLHPPSHLRAPTPILPATPERERVRARDHLQFLSRQKRILQRRKQDAARRQKEKTQSALAQQKKRLEAEAELCKAQKERIRADELQSAADRAAKQRRAAELQEAWRNERLSTERERGLHARTMLEEMLDEERNLSLRLEALRLRQSQLAPLVPPSSSPSKR